MYMFWIINVNNTFSKWASEFVHNIGVWNFVIFCFIISLLFVLFFISFFFQRLIYLSNVRLEKLLLINVCLMLFEFVIKYDTYRGYMKYALFIKSFMMVNYFICVDFCCWVWMGLCLLFLLMEVWKFSLSKAISTSKKGILLFVFYSYGKLRTGLFFKFVSRFWLCLCF